MFRWCSLLAAASGLLAFAQDPGDVSVIAPAAQGPLVAKKVEGEVEWGPLLRQSGLFLGIQHAVRFSTQEGTRGHLRGPWLKDYLTSVRGLPGWHDNDSVLANFVGHPMQGSVYGNLFIANHTRYRKVPFGMNQEYWGARLRAMAFSFASSTQYELGPLGEAAWGNVGKDPKTKGMVDMVTTPTLGLAWQLTEDVLDAKLIVPFEGAVKNRWARLLLRAGLNPTRSMSNMLRFKVPWHRDTRAGVSLYSK